MKNVNLETLPNYLQDNERLSTAVKAAKEYGTLPWKILFRDSRDGEVWHRLTYNWGDGRKYTWEYDLKLTVSDDICLWDMDEGTNWILAAGNGYILRHGYTPQKLGPNSPKERKPPQYWPSPMEPESWERSQTDRCGARASADLDKDAVSALPNKPSALLQVGLNDLLAIQQDIRYEIEMDVWHKPLPTKWWAFMKKGQPECLVGMGGAVMARTLRAEIDKEMWPYHYNDEVEKSLYALDYFRRGDMFQGFRCTGKFETPPLGLPWWISITPYEKKDHGTDFIQTVDNLIRFLRAVGF